MPEVEVINRKPKAGTLARVSSYVNNLRKDYKDNLILLENGDILQGQPTCYYYNYVNTEARNVAADVVNYMKYRVAETSSIHTTSQKGTIITFLLVVPTRLAKAAFSLSKALSKVSYSVPMP